MVFLYIFLLVPAGTFLLCFSRQWPSVAWGYMELILATSCQQKPFIGQQQQSVSLGPLYSVSMSLGQLLSPHLIFPICDVPSYICGRSLNIMTHLRRIIPLCLISLTQTELVITLALCPSSQHCNIIYLKLTAVHRSRSEHLCEYMHTCFITSFDCGRLCKPRTSPLS